MCIAKNICTALDIFHSQNLIFGCLNLSSILVDIRTCRVFLDPFLNAQFTDVKGNTFFCSHYNIEYISPEMQDYLGSGSQLDDALPNDLIVYADGNIEQKIALPFTKNDDLFALGVILFALFNNNQHPLSCYIGGKEAIDILNPQSNYPSSNPHIASLMSHTSPKTSILRRTIGIFKYRLF
ncbi:MAG: hypothetical protein Q4F54_02775 [Coriobacteriia bacterium]|nr:hypothetical protein [Coriobacteriia bacterium]